MTTSIVILTMNQLPLTHACLHSIRQHTEDYELIVVDNGSIDGTVDYLREQSDVIVIENGENLGFAKGCNQGWERSSGENILFLNNDTILTEHWLDNLLRVLHENDRVGMVGPVTNYSSGHQQIPVTYSNLSGIDAFAKLHCEENSGCYSDVRRLVGFCLLAKRSLLDEIGGFDERFGIGNYEDDDLCLRALQAGYLLRVVYDSYIHHIGHATIRTLQDLNLAMLLDQNRQKASEKWGKDIHQLIYTPEITVSACIVTRNAEGTIEQSIQSIIDDVNEIIVVDIGLSDETVNIAKNYTSQVFSLPEEGGAEGACRYAFEQATQEYVIWLRQGEGLDAKQLRKLSSLKLELDGSKDRIPLSDDGKVTGLEAFVYRRAAGVQQLEQWLKEAKS